jgi:hypothetical protein
MSFLRTRRLFGENARFWHPGAFFFDALFIGTLWLALGCWRDLRQLASGVPVVALHRFDFGIIGGLGLYGFRLASYIAMIRRNRMPQTVEWSVCLAGFAFALLGVVLTLSGLGPRGYAAMHDYAFCYGEQHRSARYIFARNDVPCPAPEKSGDVGRAD